MSEVSNKKANLFVIILLVGIVLVASLAFLFDVKPWTVVNLDKVAEGYVTIREDNLTGEIDYSSTTGRFLGKEFAIPATALAVNENYVLSAVNEERWIEVDLSEQKVRAWEGPQLFLESLISSGLPGTPTPQGEFRIWIKLRATKMEGGVGRNYYYLPNVPFTMYFYNASIPKYKGYGLHGTYWHNDFGQPKSHGCVNLPTSIAQELYNWTNPPLPNGKSIVYASNENPGTRIVIHE